MKKDVFDKQKNLTRADKLFVNIFYDADSLLMVITSKIPVEI
jgi:hypothetical protein